jgi:hypothetical protein
LPENDQQCTLVITKSKHLYYRDYSVYIMNTAGHRRPVPEDKGYQAATPPDDGAVNLEGGAADS